MTKLPLLPLLGLTLVTGVALAAPTMKAKPKPKVTTAGSSGLTDLCTPTEQNCLRKGYLESTCGKEHLATCKPIIQEKLKQHYDGSSAPIIPMMQPKGSDIPANLKQGKYNAYKTAKISKQKSIVWGGRAFTTLPVDRVTKVDPAQAAQAHRNPPWDANGQTIADCSEYAYEQTYDMGRFLDAAEACRGDAECVVSVAYMNNTPGIADRTLKRKDGRPMNKQLKPRKGHYPKNDMFALGAAMLYANGFEGGKDIPAIPELEAALATGKSYYSLGFCSGGCNNNRTFGSEWRWHQAMRAKTAHVSEAEREEYKARRAKFLELVARWAAVVKKEQETFKQKTVKQFEAPFDHVMVNPFDRFDHLSKVQNIRINEAKAVQKKFGPDAMKQPASATMLQHSAIQGANEPRYRSRGTPAVGVLAAPTIGKPKPKPEVTKASDSKVSSVKPSKPQLSQCLRPNGWGPEMFFMGPISCQIGEFLRGEWSRKQKGQKSCLDLDNPDCDWAPKMFEDSLLAQVPLLDETMRYEHECKAWTNGTFSPPASNLAAVEKLIEDNKKAIGEARQALKPYEQPNTPAGRAYGDTWSRTETAGKKEWFAAQFSYDAGWRVAAEKLLDAPNSAQHQQLCELSGGAHGTVGFDAWVVNRKVNVVDGQLHVRINEASSHQARIKGKLKVLNKVVGSDNWVSNTVTEEVSGFAVRLPTPRPSFTFMAGPVPVTGAMWGELAHGINMTASGSASTSCNVNDLRFRVKGSMGPFFGAYGVGQVGVGISGVVSAGLRASLNLVYLQLPLEVSMELSKTANNEDIVFNSELNLWLSTLAGRVSVYLEFLFVEEEWEIFRWRGLGPAKIPLMPKLSTKLPVVGMK